MREHAPVIFGLAGLAVTQPVLDLFGRNPEFFVAAKARPSEIVLFAVLASFAVPVVLLLADAAASALAGERGSKVAHHLSVAFLASLLGLVLARHIDLERVAFVVAFVVAVTGLVVWLRRFTAIALLLRYLGFAPLLFLGLFLLTSPTGRLLGADEVDAAQGVTIGVEAPIVFVVLDEVPMASLMTPDGSIDRTRFPGFARLADSSTWYRNATSISPYTHDSVPAMLTSREPKDDDLPTSADHPENLFTLFGGQMPLEVTETLTDLCPADLCKREVGGFGDHMTQMVPDAAVVYGHLTLPKRFRRELPPVDTTWGGFVDDGATGDRQRRKADGGAPGRVLLGSAVDELQVGSDTLFFAHDEEFPHAPWDLTPTGAEYSGDDPPLGQMDSRWTTNEGLVGQVFQRHLLQLGYADALIGQLLDEVEASDHGKDALVVVIADHGVAFQPGSFGRIPTEDNADEVYRVPLFIKAPGQTQGVVDDRVASSVDVLPTIIDLLDVEVDWTLDGVSLLSPERSDRTEAKVIHGTGPDSVGGGVPALLEVVERNERRIPSGQGWSGVARLGLFGSVVGEPSDELGAGTIDLAWDVEEADALADYVPGRDRVPVLLHGTVELDESDPTPAGGVVVLNGRAAGVAVFRKEGATRAWSAIIDEAALRAGRNEIELYVGDSPDSLRRLRR